MKNIQQKSQKVNHLCNELEENTPNIQKSNIINANFQRIYFNEQLAEYLENVYFGVLPAGIIRRFTRNVPNFLYVSNNIRTTEERKFVTRAFLQQGCNLPWVCVNSDNYINAIVIDVDHPNIKAKLDALRAIGCPVPDVVYDPWTMRAHCFFWLDIPAKTSNEKHIGFKNVVASRLAEILEGSALPHKNVTKWAFGEMSQVAGKLMRREGDCADMGEWQHHVTQHERHRFQFVWGVMEGTGEINLGRINEILAPHTTTDWKRLRVQVFQHRNLARGRRARNLQINPDERNCTLFDHIRHHAYDHLISDADELLRYGLEKNQEFFGARQISEREVQDICNSVAKFMRQKYRRGSNQKHRGRDFDINRGMQEEERQRLSAKETNLYRTRATLFRICQAHHKLESDGKKVSVKALCTLADINRDTFYSFKKTVGYGAYQLLFTENQKSKLFNSFLSYDFSKLKQHEKRDLMDRFHHMLHQLSPDIKDQTTEDTQRSPGDAEGNRNAVCLSIVEDGFTDDNQASTALKMQKPDVIDSGYEDCPF